MASYYTYFANKYRGCEDGILRWIEYEDSVTCTRLLAGCMPIFDGDNLFGVTCMDTSIIASLSELQSTSGWDDFHSAYVSRSRECGDGTRPDLATMRAAASSANLG